MSWMDEDVDRDNQGVGKEDIDQEETVASTAEAFTSVKSAVSFELP